MTRVLKRVATYGRRGALVRVDEVVKDGIRKYRVQWGSKAAREQESFPCTPHGKKEALSFAEAFLQESKAAPVVEAGEWTTRALFGAYLTAESPGLRPRSLQLYKEHWRHWEMFFGADRLANAMTADTPYAFRAALESAGYATKTMQSIISQVRAVYNFAEATEKITRNRWHQYRFKVAKDKRTKQRAEYKQHEFLAIWRQFDPTLGNQWRGYVAIGLLGLYGMRQTATLRLQWSDIDEASGSIRFRAEWDKQGEEQVVPLLPMTRELLAVARAWRERKAYEGPYLLFPGSALSKSPIWTIQSLWSVLETAEATAGIPKIKFRGGHGFRRGLVGDLLEAGNDMDLALKAIGDRDPRMAKHYAVKRNERIERALAARADTFDTAPAAPSKGVTKGQPTPQNNETPASTPEAGAALNLITVTT